jgi:hypothetical protein
MRRLIPLLAPSLILAQAPAADLKSLDGFVKAMYTSISGPISQKRDPELQRSLFLPGARLAAVGRTPKGELRLTNMDVELYIKHSFPYMEAHGFFEREISRKVEQYGNVAQVFSTYESREKADGPVIEKGVNSFQLLFDGNRWWCTGCAWADEEPGKALPGAEPRAALGKEEAGSIDLLIKNLYGFISGPAGPRDVAKIRALFHPECRFTISAHKPDGASVYRSLSVEEFLQRAVPNWEKGFIEREARRDQQVWGNMAQVWTRYETSYGDGMKEHMRGINSLQLQFDGTRWWVMGIQFQNEDAQFKLP